MRVERGRWREMSALSMRLWAEKRISSICRRVRRVVFLGGRERMKFAMLASRLSTCSSFDETMSTLILTTFPSRRTASIL